MYHYLRYTMVRAPLPRPVRRVVQQNAGAFGLEGETVRPWSGSGETMGRCGQQDLPPRPPRQAGSRRGGPDLPGRSNAERRLATRLNVRRTGSWGSFYFPDLWDTNDYCRGGQGQGYRI